METPERILERLREAFDDAASVPLSCWNRDELADWVCGLQHHRARLDGLLCSAATAADHAAVASLDGARSLRQFVAGRTNANPADVGGDLVLGGWLGQFTSIADAFAAGTISRRHVQALRDLDTKRTRAALRHAQGYLTDAARDCSWADFVDICHRWIANADPDGELADEKVRERGLTIKTNADGTISGSFRFDPLTGTAVKNAIEREALRLWRIDADLTTTEDRQRNHRQRLADAAASLITKGVLRPDGTIGAPLLHVVVGREILEEAMARADANERGDVATDAAGKPLGDDLRIDPDDPLRRSETVDGTPVHPRHVLEMLGIATLRRLVLGADGEILDLGRSVKTFPKHLKEAMMAAARGRCADTGCDAPPSWLEADHILPWAHNGDTATGNGQMLCGPGNRSKSDRIEHTEIQTTPTRARPECNPGDDTPISEAA